MRFQEFATAVRTSFLRVKNDVTDLNLRSNQLSLAQSEMSRELKETQEELQRVKMRVAELSVKTIRTTEAPTIVRTTTAAKKVYVGSTTGGKVHVSECPFAKNINSKNKVFFNSRMKALRKGYKECKCMK